MGAGAGAHPWYGVSLCKIHYSIAFKHQSVTGRPPLGEILYLPLTLQSSLRLPASTEYSPLWAGTAACETRQTGRTLSVPRARLVCGIGGWRPGWTAPAPPPSPVAHHPPSCLERGDSSVRSMVQQTCSVSQSVKALDFMQQDQSPGCLGRFSRMSGLKRMQWS